MAAFTEAEVKDAEVEDPRKLCEQEINATLLKYGMAIGIQNVPIIVPNKPIDKPKE